MATPEEVQTEANSLRAQVWTGRAFEHEICVYEELARQSDEDVCELQAELSSWRQNYSDLRREEVVAVSQHEHMVSGLRSELAQAISAQVPLGVADIVASVEEDLLLTQEFHAEALEEAASAIRCLEEERISNQEANLLFTERLRGESLETERLRSELAALSLTAEIHKSAFDAMGPPTEIAGTLSHVETELCANGAAHKEASEEEVEVVGRLNDHPASQEEAPQALKVSRLDFEGSHTELSAETTDNGPSAASVPPTCQWPASPTYPSASTAVVTTAVPGQCTETVTPQVGSVLPPVLSTPPVNRRATPNGRTASSGDKAVGVGRRVSFEMHTSAEIPTVKPHTSAVVHAVSATSSRIMSPGAGRERSPSPALPTYTRSVTPQGNAQASSAIWTGHQFPRRPRSQSPRSWTPTLMQVSSLTRSTFLESPRLEFPTPLISARRDQTQHTISSARLGMFPSAPQTHSVGAPSGPPTASPLTSRLHSSQSEPASHFVVGGHLAAPVPRRGGSLAAPVPLNTTLFSVRGIASVSAPVGRASSPALDARAPVLRRISSPGEPVSATLVEGIATGFCSSPLSMSNQRLIAQDRSAYYP